MSATEVDALVDLSSRLGRAAMLLQGQRQLESQPQGVLVGRPHQRVVVRKRRSQVAKTGAQVAVVGEERAVVLEEKGAIGASGAPGDRVRIDTLGLGDLAVVLVAG